MALFASACQPAPASPTAPVVNPTAAGVSAPPSAVANPSAVPTALISLNPPSPGPAVGKPGGGSPGGGPGGGGGFGPPAQTPVAIASPAPVAVPAGGVGFTIVPADSEARFAARELLAANTIKNDAIGKTKDVMGSIVFDSAGKIVAGSKIVVNIQTLVSDRDQRDGFIKQTVLETRQFPSAEFAPTEVQGLTWPVPTSGQGTFKMLGNLTVHGVTKPATFDVTATFGTADVTGKASTVVTLPDFGMTKPSVPVVAEIEDNIGLQIDFKATRAS